MDLKAFKLLGSLRTVVIGSVLVAILIGALLVGLEYRERDQRAWVDHTGAVIGTLNAIQRTTLQGESAVRGYLVTADDTNLVPYRVAALEIQPQLARLNGLISDNPQQIVAAASLTELVGKKFALLKEGSEAAQNIQAGRDRIGRETVLMTQIHEVLDVMVSRERTLLTARQAHEGATRTQMQVAVTILFILALALVALAIRIGVVREHDQLIAAREADHLRQVAEDANRAKSEFLAMMSHELRTPMAGVLGIADLVLMGTLEDEPRRFIQQLRRSALSLLEILNDILDFSKIEAGKLEIDEHPFSLGDVLADVRTLFAPVASKKGVIFECDLAPGTPDGFFGDANRLRQVMVNLVNNAIKFTKQGRVELRVGQKPWGQDKALLKVEVTDTGIGMSDEVKARLFEPFVQADGKISRRFGGTGLGLAISRRLVAAMGGEIQVESVVGQGSTFHFEVPLTLAPNALSLGPIQDRRSPAPRALRPLRLLLAEDTDTVRLVIVTMLRKMGHTIVAVMDGAAAVQEAQTGQFDAILMDMQMPLMDGVEATKIIRTFSSIPIIALTADAIPEHRQMYLAMGVNGVVTKPINWDVLTTKLAGLVPEVEVPALVERRKDGQKGGDILPLLNETMIFDLTESMGAETLARIWLAFENSVGNYRRDLTEALKVGDLTRTKKVAHALKGMSAQIGADRLAARAEIIEVDAQTLQEAAGALEPLTEAADKTIEALAVRRTALA